MKLSELKVGESAQIVRVSGHGGFRKRIMEMGFVRGQIVKSALNSPLADPIKYTIMGYDVSLRRNEANMIEVLPAMEADEMLEANSPVREIPLECPQHSAHSFLHSSCINCSSADCIVRREPAARRKNIINVALVGNPNSGKTSLFNALSGSSEHVGNYSGVTVDAKLSSFDYKGYRFNITDLPGTYSLSAYTPEEVYVRRHIMNARPDVIINSVVASNLERNLFLTTELIDLSQQVVVALNMYDELEASGAHIDYESLGAMMGTPMVPTVAKRGIGLNELLDTVIDIFEGKNSVARHVHISYGEEFEKQIRELSVQLRLSDELPKQFPVRYWAIKLIEQDKEAIEVLERCKGFVKWQEAAKSAAKSIEQHVRCDVETAISDAKYGFISGALEETLQEGNVDLNKRTRTIDKLVANKWLGFPIFLFFMWLMFTATFTLGAYPQEWIENLFQWLSSLFASWIPEGALNDLVVNGILNGVGSVASFVPNILILYLFISLMEDSGYMARAAFIMDKIMHIMGLHGKSFIPLIMGFGCNVPAIMATRAIESRSSRIITILILPFVSCSARLPVYLLLAGTFFPDNAATVLIFLYLIGALVAAFTARLLRKVSFKRDETPFVMELPPYRWPTLHATLENIWEKSSQYLKKIGTVILLATIIIWFLSYYPNNNASAEGAGEASRLENSYLGKAGKFMEPVMEPLGLDWRAGVALVSSIPAKEIVVSTMGVLYHGEEGEPLGESIKKSGVMSKSAAMAFMIFILLFFPCIATLAAVRAETGSTLWMLFTIVYNTVMAWLVAWGVYNLIGSISPSLF